MKFFRPASLLALTLLPAASAQVAWTQLTPATSPSPRCCTGLVFDPVRGCAVAYGGFVKGVGFVGETWEWNGTTWTQRNPATSPGARDSHGLTYDAARGRVLLFGGSTETALYGDTWEWDGTTWTQCASTGPSPRRAMELEYDPVRDRVLLFGGITRTGPSFGDTWEWDGTTWTQRFPSQSPPARSVYGMVYDPIRQRTVLFGGGEPFVPSFRSDTWEWDGTTWTQRNPATRPPARIRHSMAWDAARQRVVMFGGQNAAGVLSDTWEWDGTDWTQRTVAVAPPARRTQAMAYDPARRQVVLFGGLQPPVNFYNDTWELAPVTPATATAFGSGCAGTGAAPRLAARPGSLPWLGDTFELQLDQLPAAATGAVVLLGGSRTLWGAQPLPVDLGPFGMAGCQLLASPDVMVPVAASAGTASLALPIAPMPSWVGMAFHEQAAVLDPGGNAAGVVVSNAGAATIGGR